MHRIPWCAPLFLLAGCSLPEGNNHLTPPAAESPAVARAETRPRPAPAKPVDMDELARTDPVAFLEASLDRYDREVQGFRATLIKQERLRGKLGPEETIAVAFREKPFSVLMDWKQGAGLAKRSLYVEGENRGRIVVQPAGWRAIVGQVTIATDDPDAKSSSRYPITEFGIRIGTKQTLASWKAARERGALGVTFEGKKKVAALGELPCWVFRRSDKPEHDPDGIASSEYAFCAKTGLQLGTSLYDADGQLVGRYHFRDVELNPAFDRHTFTREALRK
jgi:hypothetical protein